MNMFKPVGAKSTSEYLAMLAPERRAMLDFLDRLICKAAPSLKPVYSYNMPGYGSFKYKNYKKQVIDWPVIAVASQKDYVSVYVCAVENGEYVAEKYRDKLGKVSVGKSCIRFKKIEDVNLETLVKVIKTAEKKPGLVGAGAHKL